MNYNTEFADNIEKDLFYNESQYVGTKLVNGYIDLANAEKRLAKEEYYTLVTYQIGQQLPKGYVPVSEEFVKSVGVESDENFATVDPNLSVNILCSNGIQMIYMLPSPKGNARYLLASGPETILLSDLIQEQLKSYKKETTVSK